MDSFHLCFKVNTNKFLLGNPISVSRKISFSSHSRAFYLPDVKTTPFDYKNVFIGDVLRGGSCNVDVLSFCPHNLTHVETSAHILNQPLSHAKIDTIPLDHFQGLVYLIDLSEKFSEIDKIITKNHLIDELQQINLPISALAIKTPSSLLPEDFNFSGKDFLALDEQAATEIANFSFGNQKITNLILDLPSTDSENDNGKLLAHRAFFELPRKGIEFEDTKKKAITELAYFKELVQNYYYFIMTPAKITSNAIITDILFYTLIEVQ